MVACMCAEVPAGGARGLSPQEPAYPAARRLDLIEEMSGHQVADPYRWLEDAGRPETRDCLAAQEELWGRQRQALPGREAFAARVKDLLQVGYVSPPAWRGSRRFSMRRDPGQEHGILYVADADGERALVDPVAIDS